MDGAAPSRRLATTISRAGGAYGPHGLAARPRSMAITAPEISIRTSGRGRGSRLQGQSHCAGLHRRWLHRLGLFSRQAEHRRYGARCTCGRLRREELRPDLLGGSGRIRSLKMTRIGSSSGWWTNAPREISTAPLSAGALKPARRSFGRHFLTPSVGADACELEIDGFP